MRTTVTLDPDVVKLLKAAMREREVSFKQVLNDSVRAGLRKPHKPERYRLKTYRLGAYPIVNLTKAIALAAQLEDEELLRKMDVGK